MNRIVLIGNGFDLAHGLPTGYADFLDDYWKEWINVLRACCDDTQKQDEFYSFTINGAHPYLGIITLNALIGNKDILSYEDLCEQIDIVGESYPVLKIIHKYVCSLFEKINNSYLTKWVDIENEYYRLLKQLYYGKQDYDSLDEKPKELNNDFKKIETKLIAYLSKIQAEQINDDLKNSEIEKLLFEPFNIDDISVGGRNAFIQFLSNRIKDAQEEGKAKELLYRYGYSSALAWHNIQYSLEDLKQYDLEQVFSSDRIHLHDYFCLPENILFLNFNYTKTASLYISKKSEFREIHIHGELDNSQNPIIFGYGDEMDEDYKKIVNLNDNNYLENIKSICYLKTDNYRKLLAYLESAPYQVIIMGHSCGNSDRTMLNTLFEHPNCLSIKPYYHLKDDGSDNYIDIVQNISRDFNDPKLMRDRVVNQTYCKPLIQNETE